MYKDKERGKRELREGEGGEEDCIKIKRGGSGSNSKELEGKRIV